MIDLHCHSYFSDGLHSPEELVQKALANGVTCLSLTDHDTMDGYERLLIAAENTSLTIVQGMELSARWKKHDIHILGYGLRKSEGMNDLINRQYLSRIERAKQIGAMLGLLGVEDAYNKACEIAGHKAVARPHFAKVLIQEGKCKDMKRAFSQYLARGKKAYVPTPWISVDEAVEAIVSVGGQAVIAHPLKYGLTRSKLHELIIEFKGAGGEGMEVVSGEMMALQIREMVAICARFDLLASSGSDFHGDTMSRIGLGRQQSLPDSCTPIWQQWNI